jgi:uncharacterized membrane protein YdfJ with MMPL/SSD domain
VVVSTARELVAIMGITAGITAASVAAMIGRRVRVVARRGRGRGIIRRRRRRPITVAAAITIAGRWWWWGIVARHVLASVHPRGRGVVL